MEPSKSDIRLGRFLSLVLRHKPEAAGISLDPHGWADVDMLLTGVRATGRTIDRETLERIVREDTKQRYNFNESHSKIRANQGHSIEVDVELKKLVPPDMLYHGTATKFLDSIMKTGIQKQSRQYVHLSGTPETALKVGSRHGKPVVLALNAAAMVRDGMTFYYSENGVWLCDYVPPRYILKVEYPQEGK